MIQQKFIQQSQIPYLLIAVVVFLMAADLAEAQLAMQWSDQFGTEDLDVGAAVTVGAPGYVYVAGISGGELGLEDGFITKYDAAGTLLWNRQIGTGSLHDHVESLALDDKGNLYVSRVTGPNGTSNRAGFIAKFDAGGSPLWTRQIGSYVLGDFNVSTDALGNAYVAGSTALTSSGLDLNHYDALVAKYDSFGNHLWTRQFGTVDHEGVVSVSADALGNAYIAGGTGGSLGGPAAGDGDAFLAKYDSAGNQLWIRQSGTNAEDSSLGMATDGMGNAYISGNTGGSLGGPNAGLNDVFVSKYDEAGNLHWTRQFGTSGNDYARNISTDGVGNIYLTGLTEGTLGGPNNGGFDAFIGKYDEAGNLLWIHQFGTENEDWGLDVAADGLGNFYLTGRTNGDLAGTNAGSADVFIAKFSEVPEPNTLLLGLLGVSLFWKCAFWVPNDQVARSGR